MTQTRAALLSGRNSLHDGTENALFGAVEVISHQSSVISVISNQCNHRWLFGAVQAACLPLNFTLLPAALKQSSGYEAHMVGKVTLMMSRDGEVT